MNADLVVVGAGVVGLAAARAWLLRHPGSRVRVLDKEPVVGAHASGRNSGVLHAGLYYAPDSLKARFCRAGCEAWKAYALERRIPVNLCGKLVVARTESELPALDALIARAAENGVEAHAIGGEHARAIEPRVRAVRVLWSPTSASVDPEALLAALASDVRAAGGHLDLGTAFTGADPDGEAWRVRTTTGTVSAGLVLGAAGVHAVHVAGHFGAGSGWRLLPFRGSYLVGEVPAGWLRTHVYPVPDGSPFLGVHFTVTVDGRVKIGPTATPTADPEDYRPTDDEPAALLAGAASLVDLDGARFGTWGRPGIRAQLADASGRLATDFVIETARASVHVLNAVSPALTAALPLADHLALRLEASGGAVDAHGL